MTTHQHAPDGVAPGSDVGTFQGFSLPEAAQILGVSRSSVRRMIQAGRLEARRVLRPQGYAWEVRVPARSEAGTTVPHHAPGPVRSNAPQAAPAPSGPEALAAWAASLLAPLAEANARQHETIERQADTIRDQAETVGSLRARLAAAEERVRALEAPQAVMGANLTARGPETSTEPSDANCHQNGEASNLTAEAPEPPTGPSRRRWWALFSG